MKQSVTIRNTDIFTNDNHVNIEVNFDYYLSNGTLETKINQILLNIPTADVWVDHLKIQNDLVQSIAEGQAYQLIEMYLKQNNIGAE